MSGKRIDTIAAAFLLLLDVAIGGILKGIDPILTADALHALRSAGHGDTIAIVDINFPAFEVAQKTTYGKVIPLAGASAEEALAAVASVCPVDLFVDQPLHHMAPDPGLSMPPLGEEVINKGQEAISQHCNGPIFQPVERAKFYGEARKAFAIIQTAERRPYGNFLIKKGVVGPDGNDLQP